MPHNVSWRERSKEPMKVGDYFILEPISGQPWDLYQVVYYPGSERFYLMHVRTCELSLTRKSLDELHRALLADPDGRYRRFFGTLTITVD